MTGTEPTNEGRIAFLRALADSRFISPDGSDPRWQAACAEAQQRVERVIVGSRRDENVPPAELLRQVGPSRSFGVGFQG